MPHLVVLMVGVLVAVTVVCLGEAVYAWSFAGKRLAALIRAVKRGHEVAAEQTQVRAIADDFAQRAAGRTRLL